MPEKSRSNDADSNSSTEKKSQGSSLESKAKAGGGTSKRKSGSAGGTGPKAEKQSSKAKSKSPGQKSKDDEKKASANGGGVDERKSSDNEGVSRETPNGRKRSVSAEARQEAMRARMNLGGTPRSEGSRRPSDMFFTPSATESAKSEDVDNPSPDLPAVVNSSALTDNVSRETGQGQPENAVIDTSKTGERPVTASAESRPEDGESLQTVPGASFREVDVNDIHPNRKQPRQVFDEDELAELAYSIGELGVLQPVVVRPSREAEGPAYELVMGERRWRATQRAGLERIPAIVRETSDDDLLRDALLENLHRSQLNPLEEAAAYQQLMEEFGASQEELSRRIGRSRPQISNTLRLLRLPALVQRRVAAGILSAGHARALLALEDPAEMERLAQRIVAEGLSVRATEEAVTLSKSRKPTVRRSAQTQERHRERLDYIADAFSDKLDTSVKINLGARKGRMTIEFASVEDLNRIISVLDPQGLPENQE
ncbi:ParB/RepB/Spo0J family partition protein [Kocuria sp. JC486]|uniref:ParB/RepB/Spo0J family partition protein n=1 Tax=Kocuria sp. JC486 TaxID=1970736 RepID=UPI0032AFEDE1